MALTERHATRLEELAREIAEKAPDESVFEDIIVQIRKSAEMIRDPGKDPEERIRAALREFSSLENLLERLRNREEGEISAEELRKMAEALARKEETRPLAELLQQGKLEHVARELERLLARLKQEGRADSTLESLARSLHETMAGLTAQEREGVAQQMQQAADAARQDRTEAMRRLAEMLRNARVTPGSRRGASSNRARSLEEILRALQQMKGNMQFELMFDDAGNQPGLTADLPRLPGGIDDEGKGRGEEVPHSAPSGRPGSEMDFGTTGSPFGDGAKAPGALGQAKRVTGQPGPGESLYELLPALDEDSRATVEYRQLYEVMAAAAEEAVTQEDIPLGSRFLIRRYFERIRPTE